MNTIAQKVAAVVRKALKSGKIRTEDLPETIVREGGYSCLNQAESLWPYNGNHRGPTTLYFYDNGAILAYVKPGGDAKLSA